MKLALGIQKLCLVVAVQTSKTTALSQIHQKSSNPCL